MKNIDWGKLPFGYQKTNYNVRCYNRDGVWGKIEVSSDEYINMHMAACVLHYGQEAFEGMKAYRGKDGKVRLFRIEENAKRMIASGEYIKMQAPSVELFEQMVKKVVELNEEFVPPYESGATLYIRPTLIGTGPRVGVHPADEYLFFVFVTPVGPYFKNGFKPISAIIDYDHDRAAPCGTGHIKVGGNYGASLASTDFLQASGCSSVIYVDAKERKYVDECGAANFFGIKNNTYVTPKSHSVLPSITNKSLMAIAEDMGLTVDRRPVAIDELGTFDEAGACGTAAVITPIGKIIDPKTNKIYEYGNGEAGEWSKKLYDRLRAIQYGDAPDKFGWVTVL